MENNPLLYICAAVGAPILLVIVLFGAACICFWLWDRISYYSWESYYDFKLRKEAKAASRTTLAGRQP